MLEEEDDLKKCTKKQIKKLYRESKLLYDCYDVKSFENVVSLIVFLKLSLKHRNRILLAKLFK